MFLHDELNEMADDDYEWRNADPNAPAHFPEWSCEGSFSIGRRFANMTYAELYNEIQKLHIKNGGLHLDVQNRAFTGKEMEALPGIIKFYCPHCRDHGEQRGLKKKLNPDARRAERGEEARRIYFNRENPCEFHFFVRRSKHSVVPLHEGSKPPRTGHKEYMQSETKCDWYIDGPRMQQEESRRRTVPVLVHNGHPRRVMPVSKVTPDIMKFIEDRAKHQVSVASIASGILEEFECLVSDSAIYYAAKGLGYSIDSMNNQVMVKKKFKSHAEALLQSTVATTARVPARAMQS